MRAVRSDLSGATAPHAAALIALVAWLAYEWGPGNETVTPWLVSVLLFRSDSAATVLIVPVVVAAFTFLQQFASGCTALYAFSAFGETRALASERLSPESRLASEDPTPRRLAAMSFLVGTTAVALAHTVTAKGQHDGLDDRPSAGTTHPRGGLTTIAIAAAGCAAIVGVLALAVAGLTFAGRSQSATRRPTEAVLGVLSNPLLWLAITGIYVIYLLSPRHRQPSGQAELP